MMVVVLRCAPLRVALGYVRAFGVLEAASLAPSHEGRGTKGNRLHSDAAHSRFQPPLAAVQRRLRSGDEVQWADSTVVLAAGDISARVKGRTCLAPPRQLEDRRGPVVGITHREMKKRMGVDQIE